MIFSSQFILSVANPTNLFKSTLPEIAFLGRSNVGKSSLINALLSQKNLARVSNTPGRTQLLNFFLVNEKFHVVDMPGYGYAKAPKEIKQEWVDLVCFYLLKRDQLKRLYLLIDARHGFKKNDLEVMDMCDQNAISYHIIMTKKDKVKNQNDFFQIKDQIVEKIKKHPACYPEIICTSAEKKEGIKELKQSISRLVL